ncbi:hypothetical protein TcCL_Unassigned05566, partial [Trypanosoma cruzi]
MKKQMGNLTDARSLTGRASRQHVEKVKKERFSDEFAGVVCEVVVFVRMTLVFHLLCVDNGSRRHGLMMRVLLCLLSVSGTVNATADPSTHFSVAAAVVSATPAAAAIAQPDFPLLDGEALLSYGSTKSGQDSARSTWNLRWSYLRISETRVHLHVYISHCRLL